MGTKWADFVPGTGKCPLARNVIMCFHPPVLGNKKRDAEISASLLSGYCDSNTGPSGPKPDALANCATPRISPKGTAKIREF